VRTDTSKKHEGISFVLFDMTTEGVETRPIKLISGSSPFCETFFTDVKVPKDQLVGKLNGGWEIAKRLLQYERQNISAGGFGGGAGIDVVDAAKEHVGVDADGRIADGDLRTRISATRWTRRLRPDDPSRGTRKPRPARAPAPPPRSSSTPPPS
jgi:alkylation response protein AidB-like acyl-CoA dehydrogenase